MLKGLTIIIKMELLVGKVMVIGESMVIIRALQYQTLLYSFPHY